jgi:hypothetical protein
VGDIVLVDPSQYGIGLRLDATLERAVAPGWFEDELNFRLKLRVDGSGLWSDVITPRGGGPTLSWAVTLAARA